MDKPIEEAKARAKELSRAVVGLLGGKAPTPLTLGAEVRDIMTRGAHACDRSAKLNEVAGVLWDRDCGMVPIEDSSHRVVGVLTDRDLCMAALTQGRPLSEIEVESVLSGTVHFCLESDSLDRLVSILRAQAVRRLPVVDADQKLIGVVSLSDLAMHVAAMGDGSAHAREILTHLLASLGRPRGAGEAAELGRVG